MEIFLVGGAVRDELLNYPVKEHDWVVVGARPEQLLAQGFEKVGKDFPVFLHPETKDEYALARTERKSGSGYTGFICHAEPDVSLEEDLARRDLTINAIAKNNLGEYVDPYGGKKDIENKILRHVSPAFTEDPLRVLRLARFASRYAHLGFTIADETLELIRQMSASGELEHLVAERVWKETVRALSQKRPEVYFEVLKQCEALKIIFPELDALFGIAQVKEYHPEIDCGLHSLMVLQQATILSESTEVRFAALFHDLGKALTPTDTLPHHYGHEQKSIPLCKTLCNRLGVPNTHKELLLAVAEFHTHCHKALELQAKTIVKLFSRLDAFRKPDKFKHFLLACEADARGRTGFEQREYKQPEFLRGALNICEQVDVQELITQGHEGKLLGEAIHKARIHVVKEYKKQNGLEPG